MRGFRGSRAAQQYNTSRFGRAEGWHSNSNGYGGGQNGQAGAGAPRSDLPEWLKTPETKAREQAEARQPTPAVQAKPAPQRGHLKLVTESPQQAKKNVAAPAVAVAAKSQPAKAKAPIAKKRAMAAPAAKKANRPGGGKKSVRKAA